jgi:hypothetical protein
LQASQAQNHLAKSLINAASSPYLESALEKYFSPAPSVTPYDFGLGGSLYTSSGYGPTGQFLF